MARTSVEVIDELFKVMKDVVRDYPPGVRRIESRSELVPVTAFFPGGSGLWRGKGPFEKLPPEFPEKPVMFVSRAFGSKVYEDGNQCRWHPRFWPLLLNNYLNGLESVGIRREECFFTNVFMGLNPGDNTEKMPDDWEFKKQCLDFFTRQVKIVDPKIVVALAYDVGDELQRAMPARIPLVRVHSPQYTQTQSEFDDERKRIAETYDGAS